VTSPEKSKQYGWGDLLLSERRRLGFTQDELARALGVKFSTYLSWEKNRRKPPGHVKENIKVQLAGMSPRRGEDF